VVLVGLIAVTVLNASTPEFRDDRSTPTRSRWLLGLALVGIAFVMLAAALALIVIILDLAPGLEAALFFTAVVMILLFDALQLVQMVFRRQHPATA
jgi:Zn-dependent protease with chaperone function